MSPWSRRTPASRTASVVKRELTPLLDLLTYCCRGFLNRKTIYIKEAARDVLEKHGGDIPPTIDGLLELKGVGPKVGRAVL